MTAEGKTETPDDKTGSGHLLDAAPTGKGHCEHGGEGASGDVNAATKGSNKGKKGSKGYGECWHCGEWGHPRGEWPHLNDPSKAKGSIGALKGGNGKGGKGKGKGGKGTNKGGKGKVGKGYNYNYNYRSPGKGIGKGFNEWNDDWYSAWGDEGWGECDYDYQYGDDYWNNYIGSIGNVTMLLERGETSEASETYKAEQTKTTGEHDPLSNTRRARPTTTHNRYTILTNDDGSDDDDDSSDTTTQDQYDIECDAIQLHKKHRPNKRQRHRRRQLALAKDVLELHETDENQLECRQHQCTSGRYTR